MEVPMYAILFIYVIFLAIFAALLLINLYHIIMTASLSMISFFAAFFFITAAILIIYATWWFAQDINWRQTLISIPDFTNSFQSSL